MPSLPYLATCRVVHNKAICEMTGNLLRIITPVDQWAYAVEFPPQERSVTGECTLKLTARVYEGAIGLGILSTQGSEYQNEVQVVANDESGFVEISLPDSAALGSLMLRNTSVTGRSRVDLEILGCYESSKATAKTNLQEIVIDPAILASFRTWSGSVPSGYFADWTGILTRADVWAFPPHYLAIFNRDRHENQAIPLTGEHVLDWATLAQTVRASSGTFRMAALGAGWGRWLAAGAALAMQIGRGYRLVGVEAEPQHFEWMLRHFNDNKIPEDCYIALNAAASGKPGDCWFTVGNSYDWYGQAICPEGFVAPQGAELRRVKGVTIDDVLDLLSPLDYLHMDIQGAELDVLSYRPDRLDREVRLVTIGTHSAEIEAGLRKLFTGLGWECIYDVKIGSKHSIRVGNTVVPEVEFGDGVQSWQNPRLRSEQSRHQRRPLR